MDELDQQLRAFIDAAALPVGADEILHRAAPTLPAPAEQIYDRRRRWLPAAAIVLLLTMGAVLAMLYADREKDGPVLMNTTGPATATTTATTAPTSTSPPPPTERLRRQNLAPAEAAALIRDTCVVAPLVLPTSIPDGWAADIDIANPNAFSVTYRSSDGRAEFTLQIAIPNPPTPGGNTQQRVLAFRGYREALYQIDDKRLSDGTRALLWHEPGGEWAVQRLPDGIPYYVAANGISDAQFWTIANSLHP